MKFMLDTSKTLAKVRAAKLFPDGRRDARRAVNHQAIFDRPKPWPRLMVLFSID